MAQHDAAMTYLADEAMKAAADFLNRKGLRPTDRVRKRIIESLRGRARQALTEGLGDARDAHEAGLDDAASATLVASMRQAGIEAVRAVYCYCDDPEVTCEVH